MGIGFHFLSFSGFFFISIKLSRKIDGCLFHRRKNSVIVDSVFRYVAGGKCTCLTQTKLHNIIICIQEEGIEKRVPATIPQEHFGQRILVKCLQLKYVYQCDNSCFSVVTYIVFSCYHVNGTLDPHVSVCRSLYWLQSQT